MPDADEHQSFRTPANKDVEFGVIWTSRSTLRSCNGEHCFLPEPRSSAILF